VGKGTGLGLSICYGIISEHGGTIRVRNAPERGASFRIELPRQFTPAGRSPFVADQARSGSTARLLVVDAEESVLESIAAILRGAYHSVETTKSIVDARVLAQGREFDLLLADVEHLRAGCPELQAMKTKGDQAKLGLASRILWMSSETLKDCRDDDFLLPGTEILQKPFLASDLLAAVELNLMRSVAPLAQK
jgi:two-component system NtrC family sensor kinase